MRGPTESASDVSNCVGEQFDDESDFGIVMERINTIRESGGQRNFPDLIRLIGRHKASLGSEQRLAVLRALEGCIWAIAMRSERNMSRQARQMWEEE